MAGKRVFNIHFYADYIGCQIFRLLTYLNQSIQLSLESLMAVLNMHWYTRPAVFHVVVRQTYFTGVMSLGWIIGTGVLVGLLAVYSIVSFAQQIQDLSLIGMLIGHVLLQEFAPILIAIFLLMRSGVAVVTELGSIQARGEPTLLASLGIPHVEYLFMPRLVGFAISGLILTFTFAFVAVWVGGAVVSLTRTLPLSEYLFEVRSGIEFLDIIFMVVKGTLYPVLSVLVLMHQGQKVGQDPNQIPVRATYGMLGALAFVGITDLFFLLMQGLL
ncbi:MAG: ABC transporter permease [Ghiorsea sp.]